MTFLTGDAGGGAQGGGGDGGASSHDPASERAGRESTVLLTNIKSEKRVDKGGHMPRMMIDGSVV